MCGILGFIDPNLSQSEGDALARRMLDTLYHRGPDHSDFWRNGNMVLGHTRLSIIDLSDAADQPFHYQHWAMIYNGEVYNYLELKKELEALGHRFLTVSDTEVILHAYAEWGSSCVHRFVGMWSFVIADRRDDSLFISRDRFGIKPFYYIREGARFFFASEMKALRSTPLFSEAVNQRQMARFLQLGWLQYGQETMYEKVSELPASHNMYVQGSEVRLEPYWTLPDGSTDSRSFEEKVEEVRHAFLESVRIHLRSDVPLGACLSGGLDSSSIVSSVSHLYPEQEVKTFSIYYEREGYDERPWINEVIGKYPNLDPRFSSPGDDELLEHFDRFCFHQEIPVAGSSPFSQYFLMKLAKDSGVKVTLDGQGADEFFAGYHYTFYRLIATYIRRGRLGQALSAWSDHGNMQGMSLAQRFKVLGLSMASLIKDEKALAQLEFERYAPYLPNHPHEDILEPRAAGRNRFDDFLHRLLFTSPLPSLLHYEDRNSMAHSIESRVPFLDHRLVECVTRMNPEDKIRKGVTKSLLREAMKDILPKPIYDRKDKVAFATPGEVLWLRGPLSQSLEIVPELAENLDMERVGVMLSNFRLGDDRHARPVWRLAMLNRWMEKRGNSRA